jgi:hypothetical protein
MITENERRVLGYLTQASHEFYALPGHHPSAVPEWTSAIHRLQDLIAFRVASRVDPDQWWQSPDSLSDRVATLERRADAEDCYRLEQNERQ